MVMVNKHFTLSEANKIGVEAGGKMSFSRLWDYYTECQRE